MSIGGAELSTDSYSFTFLVLFIDGLLNIPSFSVSGAKNLSACFKIMLGYCTQFSDI